MPQTEPALNPSPKLRLGFPTVATANDSCHFVWASKNKRIDGDARLSASYYGNPNSPQNLDNITPFAGGNAEIKSFLDLLDAHNERVTFFFQELEGYQAALKIEGGKVQIGVDGSSNALALAMVCIAEQMQEYEADTPGLLVSCSREINGIKRPVALGNDQKLTAKISAITNFGAARICLALHPNNLKGQDKEIVGASEFFDDTRTTNPLVMINVESDDFWKSATQLLVEFGIPHRQAPTENEATDSATPVQTRLDLLRAAMPMALATDPDLFRPLPSHFSSDPLQPIQQLALDEAQHVFTNMVENHNPKDLIISGPAGCGKTALTEALMLNGIFERKGGCIYLAPTRSLAYEVHRRFSKTYGFLWGSDDQRDKGIIVSTGERGESDWRIQTGQYSLACLVSEKANVLLDVRNSKLLCNATLLIVDELHMIGDPTRGGVVDLLLTKFRAEQLRRHKAGDNLPLQIVGVSTEGLGDRILQWWKVLDGENSSRPLTVTSRTIPVAHKVVVYNIDSTQKWKEIDLLVEPFQHQSQRAMSVGSKDFADRVTYLSNSVTGLVPRRYTDNKFFSEYLVEMRKEHETVIFAFGSKDTLRTIASQLKNNKSLKVTSEPGWLKGFKATVKSSGETENAKKKRIEWAEHGVFVHDADTPENLRRWVEDTFSTPKGIGEDRAIILCTETLTYGVNLSASAVVIGGLKFPRDGTDEYRALDSNQFHNLMGRAGRLGLTTHATPVAAFCIPIGEIGPTALEAPVYWKKLLASYYSQGEEIEAASALYARADVVETKLRVERANGSVAKRLTESVKSPVLESIQAPTFRAVIDTLHHLGGSEIGIKESEIKRFLEGTIYNGTCPIDDISATQILVTDTLGAAAKYENTVRLIEASPQGGYRVRPAAKALIDTGTQLSAVAPIAGWLKVLREWGRNTDYLRSELIIPGLVLTPEYWNAARKLCSEGNEANDIDETIVEMSRARSEALLKSEYDHLEQKGLKWETFKTSMIDHLNGYSDSLRHESNTGLKWSIFAKLTAMALAWLRGQEPEPIVAMYDKVDTESEEGVRPPAFHARYAERLSWLTVMTHRFFGDAGGLLPPSMERDLPTLTRRLRVGLPPTGLPFLGAKGVVESLRANVVNAVANGVRPRTFLLTNESTLIEEKLQQKFRNLVRGFYRAETERIRFAISRPGDERSFEAHVVEISKHIEELLKDKQPYRLHVDKESKEYKKSLSGIQEALAVCLNCCIGALQGQHGARRFVVNTKSGSISHGGSVIYFLTTNIQQLPNGAVGIYVGSPWYFDDEKDLAKDIAHVTSLGAGVTLALLARGLLSWTDFFKTAAANRGKSLSLRTIVAAALTSDLRNAGSLLNTLLQFEEPGIL